MSYTPAHANNDKIKTVVQNALNDFIRPGYVKFEKNTKELSASTKQLCEVGEADNLNDARLAFKNATLAWAEIEMIQFGPVMAENRLERILYYPDRKGRGLRQIQKIITTEDASAVDKETLAKKSIAVQGFPALEFILFGTGSEVLSSSSNSFRCQYGLTVSENLNKIANELSTSWKDLSGVKANFKSDDPKKTEDAMVSLLSSLVHGLETVRYLKLGGFLANDPKKDKPKKAIYARSENTFPTISANIKSLYKLFTNSRMQILLPDGEREGISKYLLPFPKSPVVRQIRRTLIGAIADINSVTETPSDAVLNSDTRYLLTEVRQELNNIARAINSDYIRETGLRTGFSFSDGD